MSDTAICVEKLSKLYQIGARDQHDNLRDQLADLFSAPLRWLRNGRRSTADSLHGSAGRSLRSAAGLPPSVVRQESTDSVIWALKDVSFEVKRGEVVGVIGRNGAGKTTLLKILSRITKPTEGRARINGRVSSLLEVGTGFHAELTGRENIYLNGAILGMKKREIDRKFDDIVAFAEVEKFIDTPVKYYSSGMYVRLAFAVAAHLEPEILLVDEVLAVGDLGFQRKCLGKMGEVGGQGRTVLFVSHNMAALTNLCQRAFLLDSGSIVREGLAREVVQNYLSSFGEGKWISLERRKDRYGDGRLRITHVSLADGEGRAVDSLRSGEPGQIVLHYRSILQENFRNVHINLYLLTAWGERLCDFQTDLVGDNFAEIGPTGKFVCLIPRVPLQSGSYPFTFRVYSSERIMLDEVQNAGRITVEQGDFYRSGRVSEQGIFFADHCWKYFGKE